MSNSAFTPSVLTIAGSTAATSGEKNYILSPDDNTASRWVSSTSPTVTISTSTSTIPDNITKTTSLAIAWSSGTTGYARYRFTLDQADYGKKFKISWDQIYATAGHWTLEVYSNTSAAYTGTETKLNVATSAVPGITGTFTTSVDMSGSTAPYIEVRIIAASTSATTIYLNNILVGPGTIVQGAVVSNDFLWTNPTTAGFGTISSPNLYYARRGNKLKVQGYWTNGTTSATFATLTLPLNLTIDGSLIPSGSTQIVGFWAQSLTTGNSIKRGTVLATGTNTLVRFGVDDYTNGTSPLTALNGSAFAGNSVAFEVDFEIPIAEWASSGTVNLGPGSQVEYVSNNSATTTAGATISESTTVYGPAGTAIASYASTTATGESKTFVKVQFQYPVQNDDVVSVELFDGNNWLPAENRLPTMTLNAASYGVLLIAYSSTVYGVAFGNAGYAPSGAASYGAAGGAWSVLSAWKWRVRKAKASSPVGFGLAGTDGSAGLVTAPTVTYSNSGTTLTFVNDDGTAIGSAPATYTIKFARTGNIVTCHALIANTTPSAGKSPAFQTVASQYIPATTVYAAFPLLQIASTLQIGIIKIDTNGRFSIYKSDVTAIGASAVSTAGAYAVFSYSVV
jgi:hypothetical protein